MIVVILLLAAGLAVYAVGTTVIAFACGGLAGVKSWWRAFRDAWRRS